MFDSLRPATRITLAALLAGCLALQWLLPLVGAASALPGLAAGVVGFVAGTVVVSIGWLLLAVPGADVRPATVSFLLLVATVGPGFALLLTWLFGDEPAAAA